jgi:GrpB-like predicted nucleotidyltransferase (UPF0157 family)
MDAVNKLLGLKRGSVHLVPYNPQWVTAFKLERQALTEAIGKYVLEIEHIGSTSIPGIVSKPLIDIGIAIEHYEFGYCCVQPLQTLAYEYRGEYGIPGRHFFVKGASSLSTHHIQMFERSNPAWSNYLLFRNYLRGNPDVAHQYSEIKTELSAKFADNRIAYQEAKGIFVNKVLCKIRSEGEY